MLDHLLTYWYWAKPRLIRWLYFAGLGGVILHWFGLTGMTTTSVYAISFALIMPAAMAGENAASLAIKYEKILDEIELILSKEDDDHDDN